MKCILAVTHDSLSKELIGAFERRRFIKVGQGIFVIAGYRAGPDGYGEFDLEDAPAGVRPGEVAVTVPFGSPQAVIRSPEWNGEGLPPAGAICELRTKIGSWGEAEIKYQGRAICVWRWVRHDGNTEQIEHAECPDRIEFRQLLTPEQKADKQRTAAIRQILADAGVTGSAFADDPEAFFWAAALYDAGYRKVDPS